MQPFEDEDGEDDLQDAASERQDAILKASWRALGRSWSGPEGFGGSKVLSGGVKDGVKGAALRDARALSKTSS